LKHCTLCHGKVEGFVVLDGAPVDNMLINKPEVSNPVEKKRVKV
jgi:hypothetical protein